MVKLHKHRHLRCLQCSIHSVKKFSKIRDGYCAVWTMRWYIFIYSVTILYISSYQQGHTMRYMSGYTLKDLPEPAPVSAFLHLCSNLLRKSLRTLWSASESERVSHTYCIWSDNYKLMWSAKMDITATQYELITTVKVS